VGGVELAHVPERRPDPIEADVPVRFGQPDPLDPLEERPRVVGFHDDPFPSYGDRGRVRKINRPRARGCDGFLNGDARTDSTAKMNLRAAWIAAFGVTAAVVAVLWWMRWCRQRARAAGVIPRVIWTYWHDPRDVPPVVRRCMDTWRRHNPDFRVELLDLDRVESMFGADTVRDLFPRNGPRELHQRGKHYRAADLIRMLVLSRHGGYWLDGTIICTRPLRWVEDVRQSTGAELIGFSSPQTRNRDFPILENWFFACVPGSPYVADWLEEARFMSMFPDEERYVRYVTEEGTVDLQGLTDLLPYLVVHLCATAVHQRRPGRYRLHLADSGGPQGPFLYLHRNDWESRRALEGLCQDSELQTPLVKLRGAERDVVVAGGLRCNSDNRDVRDVVTAGSG
jgi:hypothetical protein